MEDLQNRNGQTSNRREPQSTEHEPMDAEDINRPGHIRLIVDPPNFNFRDYVVEPMDEGQKKPGRLLNKNLYFNGVNYLAKPQKDNPVDNLNWMNARYADKELEKREQNCPVCTEQFRAGQSISQLECGHLGHLQCFRQWFKKTDSCPICRKHVRFEEPPFWYFNSFEKSD
jgi:hypothetical protein